MPMSIKKMRVRMKAVKQTKFERESVKALELLWT